MSSVCGGTARLHLPMLKSIFLMCATVGGMRWSLSKTLRFVAPLVHYDDDEAGVDFIFYMFMMKCVCARVYMSYLL